MKTKSYPGNKSATSLFPNIIGLFPPHDRYFELFGGSGQILLKKAPARLQYIVELDVNQIPALKKSMPVGTGVLLFDAIEFLILIKDELGPTDLIYADPPYIITERRSGAKIYKHELSLKDHQRFLKAILATRAMVAISHYECKFYDDMLLSNPGWHKKVINVATRRGIAKEAIYFNFEIFGKKHETTFTGNNKTDRQRIKRKAARWANNFKNLPASERQVIMEQLQKI